MKLVEVLADISYVTIEHITSSGDFQHKVIYNVLVELLKDEDQRVRTAVANAIAK